MQTLTLELSSREAQNILYEGKISDALIQQIQEHLRKLLASSHPSQSSLFWDPETLSQE